MKDLASIWRSLSVKWGDRTGRLGVCVHVCRSMCACVYFMVIIGAFPTIPGFSRRFPGFPGDFPACSRPGPAESTAHSQCEEDRRGAVQGRLFHLFDVVCIVAVSVTIIYFLLLVL